MIKLDAVTKTYHSATFVYEALKGVSFTIQAGEAAAIIGPSGSGKTTTMNIIGLLDRPTSGEYCLDGKMVSHLSVSEKASLRNQSIGFVFQSFNLLPRLTAVQNVMLTLHYCKVGGRVAFEKAMYRLEQLGMADYAQHKPSELSGGQQQRVAIARALVNDPAIILADEPAGALDSKTSEQIMEVLLTHCSKTTVVIITHDQEIARLCSHVIQICDGVVSSER